MSSYRIVVTPDAENDVAELCRYIAGTLSAPRTALAYIRSIREEVASLAEFPARYKLMDEEPWHSRGIRRIMAKNSYVYYRVDDPAKNVYILNVFYARRDQLKALSSHMGME